ASTAIAVSSTTPGDRPLHQSHPALEDVIEGHSCRHSHYIRKACEANIGGCWIGSLANNAILSEKIQEHSCPIDSSQH
ncbi:unnamed protein product, partial [Musa hybrid cultivar]